MFKYIEDILDKYLEPEPTKEEPQHRDTRKHWNNYFMRIAKEVATRSTCLRRNVGAVAVKDRHILATGYNGAASGEEHCLNIGCLREQLKIPSGQQLEKCRAVHAEQNAVAQAAKHGVSLDGATLYCTTLPCPACARLLVNTGIKQVFYLESYGDTSSLDIFTSCGVEVNKMEYYLCNS